LRACIQRARLHARREDRPPRRGQGADRAGVEARAGRSLHPRQPRLGLLPPRARRRRAPAPPARLHVASRSGDRRAPGRGPVEDRPARRRAEGLARRPQRQPGPRVAARGDAEVPALIRRAFLAAAAGLLAACAAMPPAAPLPQLTGIPKSFEMSGRLSIRQADRSDIARLRWTRARGSDVWVFSSPIGNEVARIESGAGGARLARAGGPAEEAPTFAELAERILGIALEPDQFSAWLHGKSGPSGLP